MEKLTILKSLGILFGVAGAIVTTGKSMFEGGQFGTGIIFLACGVLGSALYYLTQKTVYPYYDPLLMTAMAYFFGALTSSVIGVSICTEQQDAFRMPGANKHLTWITLTYAIVFASCFCYWFMSWANKHLEASTIGLYGLVQMLATGLLGLIVHQPLPVREIGGAVLVIAGIGCVVYDQQRIRKLEAQAAHNNDQETDEASRPLLADSKSGGIQ
eukprot:m.61404 g.61404  ORF g.61404 m.61404 type:complete len:214 (+) comp19273_c0_seq1:394-1035(+)